MVISETSYTVAEFEAYAQQHPDKLLELIHGRIIEKVTGRRHGKIVLKIGAWLVQWADANEVKGHYGTEVHHRLPDDAPDADQHVKQPDVSFEYTDEEADDSTVVGMPDFVVEVKSPDNSYSELREKAEFYLAHGTRLVWLIYPTRQLVEVYFADGSSELYKEGDTLSGGAVLPDFSVAVSEVFEV